MTATACRVVVVESDPRGHRLAYVATFVRGAGHEARRLDLLTTRAVTRTEEFREHLQPLVATGQMRVVTANDRAGYLGASDILRHTTRRDYVAVLDGDRHLLRLIPVFALRRGVVLLMRTEGAGVRSRFAQWAKAAICGLSAVSRQWSFRRLVGARTEPDVVACRGLHWMSAVEDPAPVPAAEPNVAIVTPSSFLLLCGVIDVRKSLSQLLHWARRTALADPPVLVVAGRPTEAAAEILSSAAVRDLLDQSRIHVIPRFLTNQELATLYMRADAVLALHENPGPSGAVAHAIAYGRPVIVWGSDAVRRSGAASGLGIELPDRTVAAIDAAVLRLRSGALEGRTGARPADKEPDRRFADQILAGRV